MTAAAGDESTPTAEATLDVLRHVIRSCEQNPDALFGMDEPNLRQILLHGLRGAFRGRATAESENGRGKTDLLIRDDGKNVFIAECKLYTGPAGLVDAIDQLLGYATYRDRDLGLIVFARVEAISAAIAAIQTAAERSEHVTSAETVDEHGAEVILRGSVAGDPGRSFAIRVLMVHIPIAPATAKQMKSPRGVLGPSDTMESLHEIRRAQPAEEGIEYTPTLDPSAPVDLSRSGWAVTYSEARDGRPPVGLRARPTTDAARVEKAPSGTVVAANDDVARELHAAVRRAHRDNVRMSVTGVGITFDQVAAGMRTFADDFERADPKHSTLTYGPTGLVQWTLAQTCEGDTRSWPITFVEQEQPAEGYDVSLRGTIFDLAVTLSLNRGEDSPYLEWEIGREPGGFASERLEAFEALFALSRPGEIALTAHGSARIEATFDSPGSEPSEGNRWWREFWADAAAIEGQTGIELNIPPEYDDQWIAELRYVGGALRTGALLVPPLEPFPYRVAIPSDADPLDVGDIQTVSLLRRMAFLVGDAEVDIGSVAIDVPMKVATVEVVEPGIVDYGFAPIDDTPVRGQLVSDADARSMVAADGDVPPSHDD